MKAEEIREKAASMLNQMKKKRSEIPAFLEYLAAELPSVFVRHQEDKQYAMHYGDLPEKVKVLICLAVCAALGEEEMVRSYLIAGRDHGASEEELLQAILLARFVRASAVLKSGAEAVRKWKEEKGGDVP